MLKPDKSISHVFEILAFKVLMNTLARLWTIRNESSNVCMGLRDC